MSEIIWTPDPVRAAKSNLMDFTRWLSSSKGIAMDCYRDLHKWSVEELNQFWMALAEYLQINFRTVAPYAIADEAMPGAVWFPGATLNYAEHALFPRLGGRDSDVAIIAVAEDGRERRVEFGCLRDQVARARVGLQRLGVGPGDRVAALMPNIVETVVLFLATASLGAVWTCCSPEFGARAALDRFEQVEPKVLVAVDGYAYSGRRYEIRETILELRRNLPSVEAAVVVNCEGAQSNPPAGVISWEELTARHEPLEFEPVGFSHPLWILYSSGTTGLPKGIVHGHGGIVLEHMKSLTLHFDIGPADRLFWFTTTGWMMWNLVISGLLCGATIVLYDGSPNHPDLDTLWALAERHSVNIFGVSAAYLNSCRKADLRPRERFDLRAVRMLASTGAPLSDEGFRWVVANLGSAVPVVSTSGGTDICSSFLGGAPTVPVWLGELSCATLGSSVKAFDELGRELMDEVGELVVTKPMPSMPVAFWNDPDGSKLHAAYFEHYPGVWRHGDWVRITQHQSAVIYGRSDSTLNRGGVRMGTADLYRVLESFEDVMDSLVIDTSTLGREDGELLCFIVLTPGVQLSDVEPELRTAIRTHVSPRHIPDRFISIQEVPRTLSGKKCEVPVRKILSGVRPEVAVSKSALANPDSLEIFISMANSNP